VDSDEKQYGIRKEKNLIKPFQNIYSHIQNNVKMGVVYLLDICALGEQGVPIAARLQEVGRCEAI